ncbi:hypothetical protein MLD38_004686 [Melastoma candidum]|uniref:Uncharacterized protein n=1 Tax=Melastoma candidum TaxID=119954 RepID=A0ACB9S6W3_9MYRT|nr:hypothetical protein MLD38_004686 [Melastoma candidum]
MPCEKLHRNSSTSLQPLHLQLPLVCSQQSQQAGFPPQAVERGEPGYPVPQRGLVGEQSCNHKNTSAVLHHDQSGAFIQWSDLSNPVGAALTFLLISWFILGTYCFRDTIHL